MRNKNHAIRHKYIQPNHKNSKKFFSFDIDYGISPSMFHDEFNLPEPNLFIQNPENCHAHVIYEIDAAVHLNENSSVAAIRYAAAIENAYRKTLRSDPGYSGLIIKNPLHSDWNTQVLCDTPYSLSEMEEFVFLSRPMKKERTEQEISGLGRNCQLFDELRYFAYDQVKEFKEKSNKASFVAALVSKALELNVFNEALPISEISSITKSVAGWTWNKYTGDTQLIKRGRDVLKMSELTDLKDKQSVSASITNKQRKSTTELKIRNALIRLKETGKKNTIAEISRATNLHRNTIRKYSDLFADLAP